MRWLSDGPSTISCSMPSVLAAHERDFESCAVSRPRQSTHNWLCKLHTLIWTATYVGTMTTQSWPEATMQTSRLASTRSEHWSLTRFPHDALESICRGDGCGVVGWGFANHRFIQRPLRQARPCRL